MYYILLCDLFSCTAARMFNKLTYLLTYQYVCVQHLNDDLMWLLVTVAFKLKYFNV